MAIDVKSMSDEELEAAMEELRARTPERTVQKKSVGKNRKSKEKTVTGDAVAEALRLAAELLGER